MVFLVIFLFSLTTFAQESGEPVAQTPETSNQVSTPEPTAPKAVPTPERPQKRRYRREKKAEGTKARDRFKAIRVIKSKYRLNGEYLDVDPD